MDSTFCNNSINMNNSLSREILAGMTELENSNNYEEFQGSGNISFMNRINSNVVNQTNSSNSQIHSKIICKECNNFPKIYLNDDGYSLNIICDCREYENMSPDYFRNNFIIKENQTSENNNHSDKIKFDSYCICDVHLGKKYDYFCIDCEENLCRDCYTQNKDHINHTIIDFNEKDFLDKIIEIKNILPNINSLEEQKDENLIKIIREILKIYEDYPCYNLYRCINNIYEFLKKDIKNIFIKHREMKEFFKIRYPKEFKNALEKKGDGSAIKTMRINKVNFSCLNILSNKDFKNLIKLILSNNNINDITPLLNSKFPVLQELNLSMNRIDDENAKKIFKIDMPKLNFLNLVYNNFKKYDIFKSIHVFKCLTKLYIGLNKFNREISEIDENTIYECSTIEEIGLTKGVFSDKTIDLISKFKFRNLQLLYLSCNNISSLSFVDKLDCKIENLEEIWLSSNNITEFYPLIKFNNLKKIILRDNFISNIDKLIDFVKHFNRLELINFSGNNIDKNDKDTSEIIEKAILEGTKTISKVDSMENSEENEYSKKEEIIIKL